MTFFYDLNKKLDEIRATPSTTHGQLNEQAVSATQPKSKLAQTLNERDMGKHNNATTGFAALAKKTGGGEKGARIAGAQLAKMRAKGQVEESGMEESAFQAAIGKKKYGDQGMKALQKAGRDHASASTMSNIRNKYDKYDESMADEGNAFSGAVVKAKADGIQPGEKIRVGGKEMPLKEKMSPAKAQNFAALAPPKDKITFADKIAGAKKEVDEMLGDVAAEAIKSALSGKQKQLDKNNNGKLDANDFAMLRKGGKKEVADEENDFTAHKRPQVEKPKIGTITHGHKHDTKHTATGRMVTRRTDAQGNSVGAEDDTATDNAPRGRGRPKGANKGPERVTANATKHKGGRKMADEEFDPADRGEYDQEGEMAKDDIKTIVRHAQALEKILGDNDNLPEWVQSKLAKIEGMMTSVDDYMQNQNSETTDESRTEVKDKQGQVTSWKEEGDWKKSPKRSPESARGKVTHASDKARRETENLSKEKTSTRDDHAEKAGKKVAKDIEYDEGHKGKDDNKAEKAGKKVTKDIEYDEKKDKPKKVKEQGGTDTPTASSGFSYGQGIYDSMSRELENMIAESMNVSMNMSTDPNGGPEKSLTVTATDDDALTLGMLLKNAGMGGEHPNVEGGTEVEVHSAEDLADQIRQAEHNHDGASFGGEEVCDACGQAPCGCDSVDEAYGDTDETLNNPDWPTNTETNADALQYSGGLDGPKSTGQTTIPVIAGQDERMGADDLHRLREMAGLTREGKVVDALKSGAKKVVDTLKGPNDDELLSKLEKETGGKRPEKKDDKKMEESIFSLTNQWKTYKAQ